MSVCNIQGPFDKQGDYRKADLSNIGEPGLIRAPGSATAKPAIIVHPSMLLLGHNQLLNHPVAHPYFQAAAVTLTAATHS